MVHRATSPYQQAGHIGGLISWAKTVDPRARMKPAQEAAFQRFLDAIPAEITDPAERIRRAEMLRRARMTQLSMRAASARRRAAAERRKVAEAEAELADLGTDDAA